TSSSFATSWIFNSDSTAPFTNSFNSASISLQCASSVFVIVTKLEAKKTPFTKLNLNNSRSKGDSCAFSLSGKSTLPLIKTLFTKNFIVEGFRVDSVYTLIDATIIKKLFKYSRYKNDPRH